MQKIPSIDFKKESKNFILDSENSMYELPFRKDEEYFSNLENFIYFIKAVEKIVRIDPRYKRYIDHLKRDVGMNVCQVLSNVDDESAGIEMHHGPMLTLFDCVSIVVDWFIANGKPITTFRVADVILEEHFNHNIQVVMLSKTVHQEVHEGKIFISNKQGWGNVNRFLSKYRLGLNEEIVYKINRYIELSEKYDSFDKDVLKISKNLKQWCRDLDIELDFYMENQTQ